jgi:hypothetical protein
MDQLTNNGWYASEALLLMRHLPGYDLQFGTDVLDQICFTYSNTVLCSISTSPSDPSLNRYASQGASPGVLMSGGLRFETLNS